jgi:hypothetical protein
MPRTSALVPIWIPSPILSAVPFGGRLDRTWTICNPSFDLVYPHAFHCLKSSAWNLWHGSWLERLLYSCICAVGIHPVSRSTELAIGSMQMAMPMQRPMPRPTSRLSSCCRSPWCLCSYSCSRWYVYVYSLEKIRSGPRDRIESNLHYTIKDL